MDSIKLQAYGKINLSLDVIRKRTDNYHEVKMIMQTVKLHDKIDLSISRKKGISIHNNLYFLPKDERNLMYKAAHLLMEEFDIDDGVNIRLNKILPVSAGMAGGSADGAAVLYGMNRIFRLGLSLDELKKRAVKLGADVPFCLDRGTILSEGIGDVLTPLKKLPDCKIVLAKPNLFISTKAVYEELSVNSLPASAHPNIDKAILALEHGSLDELGKYSGNILETVCIEKFPDIKKLKKHMMDMGAVYSLMSGSGPTVFGIFDNNDLAYKCYKSLRYGKESPAKQCFITENWR